MARYYPITRRSIVVVEVPVGTGDRDVSYIDSVAFSDQLAGTLGPVRSPDTLDITDELDAGPLDLGDSLDVSEFLQEIIGPIVTDTLDFNDALSGTLGPIRAPDTMDFSDTLIADELVLLDSFDAQDLLRQIEDLFVGDSADFADQLSGTLGPIMAPDSLDATDVLQAVDARAAESVDVSDFVPMPNLDSVAQDSLDFSDRLGPLYQIEDDSLHISDALGNPDLTAPDSMSVSDLLRAMDGPQFLEMLDFGDTALPELDAAALDTIDISDILEAMRARAADSLDVSDARQDADVTTARLWPNTQISNTGFTTPENWRDTNESTAAVLTIAQTSSLVSGSSQTLNGTLIVSCADVTFTPTATISSVTITMAWSTVASGGLQSGNSVNINLDYSTNDGSSWTTLATVTTVAGSGAPTATPSLTQTQINQLRFRATGSVTSGTTAVLGGATQTFNALYARVQFNASQTL